MQGRFICEDRIDDRPGCFHRVFANEQHAISVHSISQETLIGINLVRGGLLNYRKMCRLGDKFFAGPLHSGTEAERNFSWTEAEAEKIARFVSQNIQRRLSEFHQYFRRCNRQTLSGANQKWHT